jgi:hypothetical protein
MSSFSVFEIEPFSSSLRLGNMVGGLGWLRRGGCTWWRKLISRGNVKFGLHFCTFGILHRISPTTRGEIRHGTGKLLAGHEESNHTSGCSYFAIL